MKTAFAVILSLALILTASACDASKAISGSLAPLVVTLQPGVSHTETWDFSDCGFGITSDSFYVTQPRAKNGTQKPLPTNTALVVTVYDVTTAQFYTVTDFIALGINNYQSVCGHVIQMTLTLSSTARKSLDVEITQTANWAGPCQ